MKKEKAFTVTKICPQRVAARRASEVLCLVNDDDDALWLDEDDVDTSNFSSTILMDNEVIAMPVKMG